MMSSTLEQLREWLLEYDVRYGEYPEHQYEGLAVLAFIQAKLSGRDYDEHEPGGGRDPETVCERERMVAPLRQEYLNAEDAKNGFAPQAP